MGNHPTVPIGLTPRQLEIAKLMAQGFTYPQIGKRLNISGDTARKHLTRVKTYARAKSSAHLVAWLYETGLLPMGTVKVPDHVTLTTPGAKKPRAIVIPEGEAIPRRRKYSVSRNGVTLIKLLRPPEVRALRSRGYQVSSVDRVSRRA